MSFGRFVIDQLHNHQIQEMQVFIELVMKTEYKLVFVAPVLATVPTLLWVTSGIHVKRTL